MLHCFVAKVLWFIIFGMSIGNLRKARKCKQTTIQRTPEGPLPIHQHSNHTGHPTSHNNFQIIGREGHSLARNIKESIFIRINNPTSNRNIGKFNLPHIWDRVLLNTPGLTLKRHTHTIGHVNSNSPNPPISL